MAINTVITCDICGKQKGEVNHWWMVRCAIDYTCFYIWAWDGETYGNYDHVCGQECAHKALDKFMQGKITEQAKLQQKQRDAEASAAFASNSATLQSL